MTDTSKQFEQDVWAFVKTLDSSAEVLFNHKVPDKDTGSKRQVDVWINAKLGGHIPISILVSCKNYKRKLDITHVESFAAEVRSTGASTGVIYSSSGFTATALQKAKSEGLSCCRLFRNQPADIPESLIMWAYCCKTQFAINVPDPYIEILNKNGVFYWNDLFKRSVPDSSQNFLEYCGSIFNKMEYSKMKECSSKGTFPEDWAIEYTFALGDNPSMECKVVVSGRWKKYKGKFEAHLLNGSYCFSNNAFRGDMRTPPIDTIEPPGSCWEEMEDEPQTLPNRRVMAIFYGGHLNKSAIEQLGQKLIGSK
jgi:hypothetical protein